MSYTNFNSIILKFHLKYLNGYLLICFRVTAAHLFEHKHVHTNKNHQKMKLWVFLFMSVESLL
jgi:hypothetical protein